MPEEPEEKYHWWVVFKKSQPPYNYKFRTKSHMLDIFNDHYQRYGVYPYGMWALVDNEVLKVEIKS